MDKNINYKISIIIPVYNGGNYLKDAIDSTLAQTYQNCEVIVVNDGSVDNGVTEKIAKSYGNKIRYYYKKNGGVASALNYGITRMSGEYFAWCSHDDMFKKDKCEKQIESLLKCEDRTQICIGNFDLLDVDTNKITPFHISCHKKEKVIGNGLFAVLMGLIHGCTVLIHKSHFERCGLFDESLETTQDYDMWFRMFRGQKIMYLDKALVVSRQHREQGSKTIATHLDECNQLHERFTREITKEEIKKMFGGEYEFYGQMHDYAMATPYDKFYDYVKRQLLLIPEPEDIKEKQKKLKTYIYAENCTKVYIFGAGKNGMRIQRQLKFRGICIDGFIDNSIEKWGKEIKGVQCNNLETIMGNKQKSKYIVSIDNPKEIIEQLQQNSIQSYITKDELDMYLEEVPPLKSELYN